MDTATFVRRAKLGVALLGIAALIWLFASGAFRDVDADRVRSEILALGPWGPIAFLLAFALVQPLGPSGHIFAIGASLVWPPAIAFALALAGAVASQTTSFFFYRYVASEWARERIPERLARHERRLIEQPFRTVVVIPLLSFTWPLVPMLLGVSRVRVTPMLAATVVGLAPGIALDVWIGNGALRYLESMVG